MLDRKKFLIENYSKMSCAELVEILGYKNEGTVRTVACKLGLRKHYELIDIPGEKWLIHPDYPNYYISNKGRIKSIGRNKLISIRVHEGYYDCRINDSHNRKRTPRIHRLVAEIFVSNPDGLEIVNHIDGNKLNNYAVNLEWTTYAGNSHHAAENGLLGVRTDTLKECEVREICEKIQSGMSINRIMTVNPRFTRARVEKIRQRTRWKHVSGDYFW